MLQAPTATARARRGDELVVGRTRRTNATITQPGITALERHFENFKVLGIRLGALMGADSGSRGEAGYPSPSIPLSIHPTSEKDVGVLWVTRIGELGGAYTLGAETDRSLGNPAQRYLR